MGVTIVANEFSEETVKQLQEEADNLYEKYNYSAGALMHHFAQKGLGVGMFSANGKIILSCRAMIKV